MITVILPTYRRPEHLKKAIQSVLNQTYPHFQVCVYDNASGDETKRIVQEFAERDGRVKYHCHDRNIGAVENFQYGLSQVTTEFFSFLADDDCLLPEFFETAMALISHYPQAAFFLGSTIDISYKGKIISAEALNWADQTYFEPPFGLYKIISHYFNWTGAIFRRSIVEAIGSIDREVTAIDLDFVMRAAAKFPFVLSKKPCALFIHNPLSYSGGCGLKLIWPGWLRMMDRLTQDEKDPVVRKNIEERMRQLLKMTLMRLVVGAIERRQFTEADKILDLYSQKIDKKIFGKTLYYASILCRKSSFFHFSFRALLALRRFLARYKLQKKYKQLAEFT